MVVGSDEHEDCFFLMFDCVGCCWWVFHFESVVDVPKEAFWCQVPEIYGARVRFHEPGVPEIFFDGGVGEVLSYFCVDRDVSE